MTKFERLASEYTPNPSKIKQDCPPGMVWDQSEKACVPEDEKVSRKGEPARIGTLPKEAQKLWVKTYDKFLKKTKNKGTSAAIAWATVKKKCEKDYNGIWKCPSLIEESKRKKRAAKLRREAKKFEKEDKTKTVKKDVYKGRRRAPKKERKVSEEELMKRVRRIRM